MKKRRIDAASQPKVGDQADEITDNNLNKKDALIAEPKKANLEGATKATKDNSSNLTTNLCR